MGFRAFVRALICGAAAAAVVFPAAAAFGQDAPAPEAGGPPWTYYMAYGTIAIAGLTLLMFLLGYLVQSKGWEDSRRSRRRQAAGESTGK